MRTPFGPVVYVTGVATPFGPVVKLTSGAAVVGVQLVAGVAGFAGGTEVAGGAQVCAAVLVGWGPWGQAVSQPVGGPRC